MNPAVDVFMFILSLLEMLLFAFAYLLIFGLMVTVYIFNSLGIMGMMKSFGMKNPGTAFIPVYNSWLFGKVAEESSRRLNGKKSLPFGKILLAGNIVPVFLFFFFYPMMGALTLTFFVVAVISEKNAAGASDVALVLLLFVITWFVIASAYLIAIAVAVFRYIAVYKIFSCFDPEHAVLFTVLSVVINVTMPFFLFAIRNKEPAPPFIAPDAFEPEN